MASDVPTYAHFLRRMGYHTALSGKQVGGPIHFGDTWTLMCLTFFFL